MEKYRLLFESIFKSKLTDDGAVDSLEKIAAEHPYFSAAQFYLLHLLPKDTPAYQLQAKKTAALFNNNYWLNFQLLQAGMDHNVVITTDEPAIAVTGNIADAVNLEEQIGQTVTADEHPSPYFIETDPLPEAKLQESASPATAETAEEETGASHADLTEALEVEQEETDETQQPQTAATETPGAGLSEAWVDVPEETYETQQTATGETRNITSEEPAEEPKEAEINRQPAVINEAEETAFAGSPETDLQLTETAPKEDRTGEAAATNEEIISIPLLKIPEMTAAADSDALVFEPLHTSDYFASLGIKLSEEEKTGDKLGKQLKSFTDWLKTMKKVHARQSFQAGKPAGTEATGSDSSIQKLAEKSNQEDEILTEAMAEVLLQQGRQDKAVEILEKLSLLNPSKNAYFAAKINQIKEK